MKQPHFWLLIEVFLLAVADASAAVRYVDINSPSPTPPYVSWSTAATNIQDAVDAALAGDHVLVTNGVYQTGGRSVGFEAARVVVDKAIVIQSVNGPQSTLIGGRGFGRCAVLTNGVTLAGFTLTNGASEVSGGGVAFSGYPSDAVVSNCMITGCIALYGGAAGSASSANVFPPVGGTLVNCTISSNWATGGDYFYTPLESGGGVDSCRLINCTLIGNNASGPSQSKGGGAYASILQNCLVIGNGTGAGSAGGGAANSALINCTVVSNAASAGAGTYSCWLTNCIVYDNRGTNHDADNFVAYSCTTPMPTNGIGNITNAPLFINAGLRNFRLQPGSPCIDAGTNLSDTITTDLDGHLRPLDGNADGVAAFDMGAYEHAVLFVRQDSPNPAPPYNSWSTAATNIQDAVDAAVTGDGILVTNGVYATGGRDGSRVVVPSALSLRSVNGPQFTFILGGPGVRCVGLGLFASLSGFTLTNGIATYNGSPGAPTLRGGGVICNRPYPFNVVSNCVLIGNSADEGGGALGGTLINCTLMNNSARFGGGGASGGGSASGGLRVGCMLINCTLIGNQSGDLDGGGGVFNGILTNCSLANNSATFGAGAMGSTLDRCALVGNEAMKCNLYNCILTGSPGYGAYVCYLLQNCTLTANGIGAYNSSLRNCIIYDNLVSDYEGDSDLSFCCTRVLPAYGIGNITNAPIFANGVGSNLRLQSNSPCINAGQNAYAPGFTDFDGNPRIAGGTVDIGAFEFQSPSSILSYAWAQQYGLPTDGSADYADTDGDLMNNWQEWNAGTNPTNSLSALRLLNPIPGLSGTVVAWESVTNRSYVLESATNLGITPVFSLVSSNISGQPGTTSYTDTNAPGPFFYRVGVQQ